ncbi:MAG: hypothetical protein JNK25_03015 [Phycisphaerae bacterium]|nr:hypothetical protein [Phycisphaerae bacterium]
MRNEIKLDIPAQPDDVSCGPTCLYALYRHYGDAGIELRRVLREVQRLDHGGTLIEVLACHALRRGYAATIYTYHLQMFDPTWFAADGLAHDPTDLATRLEQQMKVKRGDARLRLATKACREFLALGGELRMQELTAPLIGGLVREGMPVLCGLSSTFLYGRAREHGPRNDEDDVRGEPQGHFVMLIGYDARRREVLVADPLDPNPPFHTAKYRISADRLVNAVLLGILTHDANLLIVKPRERKPPTRARTKKAREANQRGPSV